MTERQAVVATYNLKVVFPLPLGLDIEDKSIVEIWWVKHKTLYIKFVPGTRYSSTMDRYEEIDGITYKHDYQSPTSETIEYFDDTGFSENVVTELLDEKFNTNR
jgi:hypothetical protein